LKRRRYGRKPFQKQSDAAFMKARTKNHKFKRVKNYSRENGEEEQVRGKGGTVFLGEGERRSIVFSEQGDTNTNKKI